MQVGMVQIVAWRWQIWLVGREYIGRGKIELNDSRNTSQVAAVVTKRSGHSVAETVSRFRALLETEAPIFIGNEMAVRAESGKERRKDEPRSRLKGSRRQRITKLLTDIEKKLDIENSKVTLADFIRLTQLERELEQEEQPREIIVTWKEPAEKRCE